MRRILVKEGVLASGSWKLFVRRPERVGRALGFNNLLGWRVRVWGVTRQTTAVRLQMQKTPSRTRHQDSGRGFDLHHQLCVGCH